MTKTSRVALSFGIFTAFASFAIAQSSYVNFEAPQTHPIRISSDGTRLFAVDTADNRLSVFDLSNATHPLLIAEIPVGLEPVSLAARTNDEIWVVNHLSDSVSVVSVSQGLVTDTIAVKDEPSDVLFAGNPLRAFVTAARSNQVRVFDLATHAQVASIALDGNHPRALAATSDGTKVYTSFLLSGNRTTCVPRDLAPPQPPPTNPLLPPPPQVALIVDATDPQWNPSVIQYTVLDHDVAEIDANALGVTRYFDRTGTINFALAVQPSTGDVFVANTDARNLVMFETALRGHTIDSRVTRVTTGATPTVTAFDLNPTVDYSTLPNDAAKAIALSQPTAIEFDATGTSLWITSFGTDRVAKLDPNGNVLARVAIGPVAATVADSRHLRGPRGLALAPNGALLYVQNRVSNTISIVDTTALSETSEFAVGSYDPTPNSIREGRGFLYDAKLSGNGTNSCASCHIDSDTDAIAWNLGNPGGDMTTVVDPKTGKAFQMHPMKGPMITQNLRGLAGLAPYHWRGDRVDLNAFNGAFDSLMGGSQIAASDMQAFADFMNTTTFEPNPNENLDRTLPTTLFGRSPALGLQEFTSSPNPLGGGVACTTCHSLPQTLFPMVIDNILGGIPAKVPTLRDFYRRYGLYSTAPGAQNLSGFGFEHDSFRDEVTNFPSELADVRAFFACFDTSTAPIVGYTRTVTSSNAASASIVNDVNLAIARTFANDCDLIGKGSIDGVLRGLVFDRASNAFDVDHNHVGPFTWAELQAKALAGNALFSLSGVPLGCGVRMGIDRDLDGVKDGDEGAPTIYCTAKINSQGCTPHIAFSGIPSVSASGGFTVSLGNTLNKKSGLLFYSTNGRQGAAFQGGTLCVRAPIVRTAVQSSGGSASGADCSGSFALDFNAYVASGANPSLVVGVTVDAQFWSRDPGFAPPNNTNLSDALDFTLEP